MSHDVVATFSKHIRRHRNLQLFIKLHKEEEKKKRGRSQRLYPRPNNSPCNSGTFALQGHAREREREGERERGRENAEKQSQAPKKSWKVVEGGEGGLTAERIVEQPLVVAAAFIAPLQPAPV